MSAPLLITRDETLLDELLRLAAAAGVTPGRRAATGSAGSPAGRRAPLVLVGADVARRAGRSCGRGAATGVHVVSLGRLRRRRRCGRAGPRRRERRGPAAAPGSGWSSSSPTSATSDPAGRGRSASSAAPGGAGATTFAAALGQVAAAVRPDARGRRRPARARPRPGARAWRGAPGSAGTSCAGPPAGSGRVSLREGVPRRGGAGGADLLRRPAAAAPPFAVREVVSAAQRGHDTVVVDLPAGARRGARRGAGALRPGGRGRRGRRSPALASTGRVVAGLPDPRRAALVLRGSGSRRRRGRAGAAAPGAGPDGRPARAGGVGRPRARAGALPARSPLARAAREVLRPRAGRASTGRRERGARRPGRPGPRPAGRASPATLTPHRVAAALRSAGRPVGDATVLAVHETLRRDVVGAGPLEPLLRLPGVTDVLVNGPDEVYVDRGAGLERTERAVPRRRGGTPAGPAAGRRGRAPARRRHALRRRPAGRRHPLPRGARAGGPTRHGAVAARPERRVLHARRPGRGSAP